jgi:hypothetical protein
MHAAHLNLVNDYEISQMQILSLHQTCRLSLQTSRFRDCKSAAFVVMLPIYMADECYNIYCIAVATGQNLG